MSEPDADGFVRVHPLSPYVRGGLVVLAVLGYVVSQQVDRVAGLLTDAPGDAGSIGFGLLQLAGVAVVVLGAVALGLVSWWFTRYRLGEESLEMHTGAVFRQHRQVRYDRIQAVDLVRPLLARLTGLSEVRVESAGGGDSHVSIAYLSLRDAEEVRERLLGLADAASAPAVVRAVPEAAASEPGSVPPAQRAVGELVLAMPVSRLLASIVLSGDAVLVVVAAVVGLVLTLLDLAPVVTGFIPFVILGGLRSLGRLARWYGLTVTRSGDTLSSQRGLTDTRTSTVPLQRVQAVAIKQPLFWRRAGWWSLEVNVAGARIGSASESAADTVLVPVATTPEVLALLEVVTRDRGTTAEVAALLDGTPAGFVGQPARARWLFPFAHRRIGYLVGGRALVTRSGWLERRLAIAPWGRVQSLTVAQGPIARRLDLARVDVVSTVGPVRPSVAGLDRARAEGLRALTAERARGARHDDEGTGGCDPAPDTMDCDR